LTAFGFAFLPPSSLSDGSPTGSKKWVFVASGWLSKPTLHRSSGSFLPLTLVLSGDIRSLGFKLFYLKIINLIDQIDLKILSILQNSGRSRLADIAEQVDLSAPAVLERVKKLELGGVIKGYQAVVDATKVGKDITAFIGVSVGSQRDMDKFAARMLRHHDVLECHHVTGDESFVLKVKSTNTASLERLLGEIRSVEGVTRTVTKVVLSTAKETQALDLDQGLLEHSNAKKK
jgi:Lrp/AsnC family leucine-responsive transcriptional regulator